MPLNDPKTLERAQGQIQTISASLNLETAQHWLAFANGYVLALWQEGLIDEDTRRALQREANDACRAWPIAQ